MERSELSAIALQTDETVTKLYENNCLIGKILLQRPLDQTLVKSFTHRVWNCKNSLSISTISCNMFMFVFQDKQELANVLKNRPWTIMGGLLMLSPCTSGEIPHELKFSYSAFWVQAHGLPLDYLTATNGSKIGYLLGTFVRTDWHVCFGNVYCGKFLRLRVILDVRKPLVTGFWLRRRGLRDVWIDFKYENLGVFCYKCGRIGNSFWTCKFPSEEGKFGPWLRAGLSGSVSNGDRFVCGTRLGVVEKRVDKDDCRTTLLAVPKAKATFDQSSNLGEIASEHNTDFEETSHGDESTPRSNLWQRLVFNCIDSMIMLMNCATIFSRVTSVDESEGNWTVFILMAAYLFHLFRKFVRVNRGLGFLKAQNEHISCSSDGNGKAIAEILILILFLVMLISF